ncbi:uncharacterized protein LOC114251372 [Bombyx mandarina]|uniref:Uncharacterized protein LOC114251372 n=1 Tax=Bombyx mandarina TaxID=7092 RepID=A0A6J2KIM7_BOMMA|nr:uncharacterized protein LOC114251372 [Bombyx mandarina]
MRRPLALLLVAAASVAVSAQIAWTPIFLDGSSQVDLWTQSSSGCACPGEGGEECACCVRDGACPCGDIAPARCSQCGLEQYCANSKIIIVLKKPCLTPKKAFSISPIFSVKKEERKEKDHFVFPVLIIEYLCNIPRVIWRQQGWKSSIEENDTSRLDKSFCFGMHQFGVPWGTAGFGTALAATTVCIRYSFNLLGCDHNKLQSESAFCVGGWIQLSSASAVRTDSVAETRLCGANERYTPPVVLFADHGAALLEFRIIEKTVRSQFLAFFSFTSLSNTQGVGFHPSGGSRIPHTGENSENVRQTSICQSYSYAPMLMAICKNFSNAHNDCMNHCTWDYLTLRAGSSPSAPLLASLCSERMATLEHPGPNLLLEFKSGPLVPPYDYNGFIAKLEFIERLDSSGAPPTVLPASPPLAALTHLLDNGDAALDALGSNEVFANSGGRIGCGAIVRGYGPGGLRSGHFDTRATTWRTQCTVHLIGAATDVVQVSLFNYNLRLQGCRSHIEILEGLHEFSSRERDRSEKGDRALLKVCGPAAREARDPSGRFLIRQAVTSKGANLTIMVRRALSQNAEEEEFVDGAFAFHDEQHEGTASPDATCASTHYGLAAPAHGGVSAPSHHHIFWNIEERLLCTHRFIPASNQSVTVEIQRLDRMWSAEPTGTTGASGCRTACGDAGCECRAQTPLHYHDHVALVAGDGTHLSCLCGDFQAAWLPVVVRSWTSVRLEYSVAHYTYASRGFDYAAAYSFNDDAMCGQRTFTTHSGEISSKNVSVTGSLNEFFYQQCTWVLDSNVERQLFIDITSEQDKSCGSWNITLHEWSGAGAHSDAGLSGAAGDLLYTFCARHKNHTYTLPWRLNTLVIRLVALSRQQPLYTIRWRSQVVRANNRLGPPTPVPAASAAGNGLTISYILYCVLYCILQYAL